MAALAAVMVVGTAHAGYYQIGATFGDDTDKEILTTDIPITTDRYAPTAKDGSGTYTITTGGTINNALYVREGELVIKDQDVSLTGYQNNLGSNGYIPLSVAGTSTVIDPNDPTKVKDATLVVDGANLSIDSWGAGLVVGGIDGSGSLVLQNEATIKNWNGFSIFIGYPGYVGETYIPNLGFQNLHATTATPEGSASNINDRYQGSYYQAENGYDRQYGRGNVTVTGGSYFDMGSMGALYMAEGSLIVDDGSTVLAGTEPKWNNMHTSIIGRMSGSTSVIEVKDGSELHIRAGMDVGYSRSTNSTITVDNSTLTIEGATKMSNEFFDSTQTNVKSSIILQNNAVAQLDEVLMGDAKNLTGNDASLIVDSTSVVEALSEDSMLTLVGQGASVENAGTIGIDIVMNAGELTALDNSTLAAVTANGGVMNVEGNVEMTGALTLGDAVLNFSNNAVIDLGNNAITIGDGTTINVLLADGQDADNLTLFVNAKADSATSVNVNIVDADGNVLSTASATISSVPEPTTATLSLLALAGLAARRRRK